MTWHTQSLLTVTSGVLPVPDGFGKGLGHSHIHFVYFVMYRQLRLPKLDAKPPGTLSWTLPQKR